ncbi:MAG: hypothetical protein EOO24_44655 [Comamonadaceae bacterium]|nr:MAG: hypothetical protein EOO24_44655 [Comamonadaceae bacterium]
MALPPADTSDRCEAARYALLRRLAPSMRHHLVVNLQPIGMIWEVMDRRLRIDQPDIAQVHDSARRMNGFARAALASCLDVVTWLAPEDDTATTAAEGVRECGGLLATGLSFRGYTFRDEVGQVPGQVSRAALRSVLTAALVQCTDEQPAPAEVRVGARATPSGLEVVVGASACPGEPGIDAPVNYRRLGREDVEALATAEGVALARPSRGVVVLTFPWLAAPGA